MKERKIGVTPNTQAVELSLSDFGYELPKSLIAQEPLRKRSDARLLVLERATGKMEHRGFTDITDYLDAGDCLVLNDTKVLRARLFGKKKTGGRVEVLLHKKLGPSEWEVLLKPGGRVKAGGEIFFGENGTALRAEVLDPSQPDSGLRKVRFWPAGQNLEKTLETLGRVPLPPYIDRPDTEVDRELYQTVFAKREGAVASPTAGLHFDEPLLEKIRAKGVEITFVTLHVGYGTFQPVAAENIAAHKMHPEEYEVSEETAAKLNRAIESGRRIVSCGTTVVRTLETLATRGDNGTVRVRAGRGETRLFIYPPYSFAVTQSLITNFHLPRTTLLMLAAAFAGRDALFKAYEEAIREGYRFYSYGDAMLIL